jgi:hypothetical protein
VTRQSTALVAGLLGGTLGLLAGLSVPLTLLLAGGLAVMGDLLIHVFRGDPQFRRATARIRRRLPD